MTGDVYDDTLKGACHSAGATCAAEGIARRPVLQCPDIFITIT